MLDHRDLLECSSCGVIWDLFSPDLREESRDWATVESLWRAAYVASLEPDAKTILDISPASRLLSDVLSLLGWEPVEGRLTPEGHLRTPGGPSAFRVVSAWDLLDRVADPLCLVQSALKRLAPGGLLLLSTPTYPGIRNGSRGVPETAGPVIFPGPHAVSQLLDKVTDFPKIVFGVGTHTRHPSVLALLRSSTSLNEHDPDLLHAVRPHSPPGTEALLDRLIASRFGFDQRTIPDNRYAASVLPPDLQAAGIAFYAGGPLDATTKLGSASPLPDGWEPIARQYQSAVAAIAITQSSPIRSRGTGKTLSQATAATEGTLSPAVELAEIHSSLLWLAGVPIVGWIHRRLPRLLTSGVFPLVKRWIRIERGQRLRVVWGHLGARLRPGVSRLGVRLIPRSMRRQLREWMEPRLPLVAQPPWPETEPLLSVIIPCYNYGAYLAEAIESVERQSLSNLEIIVVDDGSTDSETISLIERLRVVKPNLHIVQQPNRGLPAARNAGIRVGRGRYICCLDADDRLDPTYLEKACAILESRPDIGLAYSWVRLFGDEDTIWKTEPLNPEKLLTYNFIPVSAVFRRSTWLEVGGYDEELRIGYEDWDFWLRLSAPGNTGWPISEPLIWHRRHGHTMTHRARSQHAQLAGMLRSRHQDRVRRRPQVPRREVRPDQAFIHLRAQPKRQRRLLCVLPWAEVGGAESVVLDVLRAFTKDGTWELYVSTTEPSENVYLEPFRLLTPHIYPLPDMLPQRLIGPFLTAFIDRYEIDVVLISHSALAYSQTREWKGSFPMTCIVDIVHNESAAGYSVISREHDAWIDRHIAVHEGVRDHLGRLGVPLIKIHVIENGVSAETFFPDPGQGRAWLRQERLSTSKTHIVFVGRLSPEKRPELFLRMAAQLRQFEAEWLLVGDGPLRQVVANLWSDLQRPCVLLGERHDVAPMLRGVDLLVITSKEEGMPIVALEALLTGVPVVTPSFAGLESAVEPGLTGLLLPKGDDGALTQAVASLLSRPDALTSLKESCRSAVPRNRERFSSDAMGHGYVRVIQAALDQCLALPADASRT